jgi:predicted RNA polymerase sigma factor
MHVGPEQGLLALAELEGTLSHHHLFFATRADYERALALALASNDEERRLLQRKLDENR